MWKILLLSLSLSTLLFPLYAQTYQEQINAWRSRADASLRRDNGWLTLAGRWPLRLPSTTVGTAADNHLVFPQDVGPAQLGRIDIIGKEVFVQLSDGLQIHHGQRTASGRVQLSTNVKQQEWWQLSDASGARQRLAFTVFEHPVSKAFILRIADQENILRKNFTGRQWFAIDEKMKVAARFYPASQHERVGIVNVLGEIAQEK
ncbi:MAG: hypothetical protein RLZZ502_444, partial [Pseudomonadota bacterium]